MDAVFRLASGSSDPVSTNQTLDGGFSSKNIWLDQAYFNWHPSSLLNVLGGKVKNPFFTPGKTELLWDGDLNPEGMALMIHHRTDSFGFFLNAGGFWITERKADDDSMLYGAQLGLELMPSDSFKVTLGGSVFSYTEVKDYAPFYDAGDSFGNSVTTDSEMDAIYYATDFTEMEGFLELGMKLGNLPLSIFGDYVVNTDADEYDTGYLAGISLGKCKEPWSWALGYNYREVEADAVLGAFTDSDFAGGGTDAKGHEASFSLQVAKNAKCEVSYFMNELGLESSSTDYNRLMVDVNFKF